MMGTELQPGMVLFKPDHKSRVIDAVKGYFESKTSRMRKKGIAGRVGQRKAIVGYPHNPNNGDNGNKG